MNAFSHEFDLARASLAEPFGQERTPPVDPAAMRASWEALHDAANAVALLAQLAREEPKGPAATLPERAVAAGGRRCEAVEQGISDLSAVMQAGLRALLGASDDKRDTTAAAVTLWREFHAARAAILALVEPQDGLA